MMFAATVSNHWHIVGKITISDNDLSLAHAAESGPCWPFREPHRRGYATPAAIAEESDRFLFRGDMAVLDDPLPLLVFGSGEGGAFLQAGAARHQSELGEGLLELIVLQSGRDGLVKLLEH
jgi:hypothetical protein